MGTEKPEGQVDSFIDPVDMPGLGAGRTTEEVIADIVAKNPAKHGVTLEERKRRAEAAAREQAEEARKFFEEPE